MHRPKVLVRSGTRLLCSGSFGTRPVRSVAVNSARVGSSGLRANGPCAWHVQISIISSSCHAAIRRSRGERRSIQRSGPSSSASAARGSATNARECWSRNRRLSRRSRNASWTRRRGRLPGSGRPSEGLNSTRSTSRHSHGTLGSSFRVVLLRSNVPSPSMRAGNTLAESAGRRPQSGSRRMLSTWRSGPTFATPTRDTTSSWPKDGVGVRLVLRSSREFMRSFSAGRRSRCPVRPMTRVAG